MKLLDAGVMLVLVVLMACCMINRDDVATNKPDISTAQAAVDTVSYDPLNTPPSGISAVNRFYAIVAEYFRTVEEENSAWMSNEQHSKTRFEKENLTSFFTWCCLRDYYQDKLTPEDKRWLFANLDGSRPLPVGIAFDYWGPITDVLGFEPTGNPRADFEDFLLNSFPDTDYQTGFDAFHDAKAMKAIHQTVRARMKSLGVEYPNDLSQAESLLTSE
ncbi:MAG: hypothetical protein WCW66_00070 [Patescibacteria group bacterium]